MQSRLSAITLDRKASLLAAPQPPAPDVLIIRLHAWRWHGQKTEVCKDYVDAGESMSSVDGPTCDVLWNGIRCHRSKIF